MPAIWLSEDSQFEKAQALLNTYQNERTIRMREEYARLKREGKNKTFADSVARNPVRFTIHLALALLVIYLSVTLVLDLAK